MRKNYIKNPNLKTKSLSVQNLKSITSFALNLSVNELLSNVGGFIPLDGELQEKIMRLYNVRDRIFCYSESGNFYEYASGAFRLVKEQLDTEPIVFASVIGGIRKILVITKTQCFRVDTPDVMISFVPYGDCALVQSGRLFYAKENKLYYGSNFNFTENTVPIRIDGVIGTTASDGEIIAIEGYGEETLVIKNNAIYVLMPNEQTAFKLEKVNLPYLNVHSGSVKTVGDKIIFISDGVPCYYKNSAVSQIDGIAKNLKMTANGRAVRIGGKYILPVLADGKSALYVYDTTTCEDYLIGAQSSVVCDGGYITDSDGKTLYMMDDNGQPFGELFWQSKSFDFGVPYGKQLAEISLYTSADCTFTVNGEFGEKKFFLKKGYSIRRLNLPSRKFSFTLSTATEGGFYVRDLKLKYRVNEV